MYEIPDQILNHTKGRNNLGKTSSVVECGEEGLNLWSKTGSLQVIWGVG